MRLHRLFYYGISLLLTIHISACSKKGNQIQNPAIVDFEILPPIVTPITLDVNSNVGGFYSAVPYNYTTSAKKYPLLIFLHGGGQFGNGKLDLPLLLNEGIPLLLDEKLFPPDFELNGEHFSFIILAPQFRRQPANDEVRSFVSYAISNYRVDSSRIYMAGMSNGGRITCNTAAAYPGLFSSIVAMSGVSDSVNLQAKCNSLASANTPMWIFHNDSDQLIPLEGVEKFLSLIDELHPKVMPRFTEFSSEGLLGHDSWTRATNPGYKEQDQNIYQWMLGYHK